ncbi:MAG: rhamnogalacturonan lyase B N-terminal domain-containing protein [Luteolibacter sp.]
MRTIIIPLVFGICLSMTHFAHAEFGLKDDGKSYEIDTGAGLVVQISQRNGDIRQILWNGDNLSISRGSHIKSGLGPGTKVTAYPSLETGTIIVTAEPQVSAEREKDENDDSPQDTGNPYESLVHYYVFRRNEPVVYMATYIVHPFGELRWITRLNHEKFDRFQPGSDLSGNIGPMESKDVFKLKNGESRSKYYGNQRAKELTIRGITGPGVGIFMAYGSRETASGGPFFRDIQNQTAEVYNYMFSGHNQTEKARVGLHGPYALVFTHGEIPLIPDMSFMATLGIKGWVPGKERGYVTGTSSGTLAGLPVTVGWANETAQYWSDGPNFRSPAMKPGIYDQTLYQGEFAIAVSKVKVEPGKTTRHNISASPTPPAPLWRIGIWDGTPGEFANGTTFPLRHPSDPRNAPWPKEFTIGKDQPSAFPAAQWADINHPIRITFDLKRNEVKPRKVTIGLTAAYTRGRPSIRVNDWNSKAPSASLQPDSRSLTIGTYRGANTNFDFEIPAKALKPGRNTLEIHVVGQGGFGAFLSPGYAFDCIEMR